MTKILFEDNHLLAAVKPCGIPTQAAAGSPKSFEEILKEYIKVTYHKKGNVFLHAIHRLDKLASGIVLFAKSQKALSRLQETIRKKTCKKIYLALVSGSVALKEKTVEHFLVHGDHKAFVDPHHPQAKKCVLHYRVIQKKEKQTLLEIELITGRYHQIRCQLAALGHPIIGDGKYGSSVSFPNGIALHHACMEIEHPITKKPLLFTAQAEFSSSPYPEHQSSGECA